MENSQMDHDGNLRHLVYNMDRVRHSSPPPSTARPPHAQRIDAPIRSPQAVKCMDEANGVGKMVVVLDCHNYRREEGSVPSIYPS